MGAPEPAESAVEASLHGNVKAFFVAGDARPWFGLSDDAAALVEAGGLTEEEALAAYGLAAEPFAQGVASGRLLGVVTWGPVRLEAHWAVAASAGAAADLGVGTGVELSAPELLPLTWSPELGDGLSVQHRVDRLVLSAKLPHVDVALGRQPISFGSGRVFTPLDLVNPFHPATIDTEYKSGVDALRVDAYAGVASHVTAAVAWAGDPVVGPDEAEPSGDDVVAAAVGQVTVGVTDLSATAALVHGEPVFGASVVGGAGPVGIHGDATLTLPDGADPFVRAVVGADGRPGPTTSLSGELYVQTFGAADPSGYLPLLEAPRALRGEVWQVGRYYAALSVGQEVTPLVRGSVSVIANLADPSALLAVGGSWSVADNADVVLGGYAGVGRPPDTVDLSFGVDPESGAPVLVPPTDAALADSVRSEFGLYPTSVYLQLRAYF